jgi:DsbC/DsbD-like thiol-disulfide interchange protein
MKRRSFLGLPLVFGGAAFAQGQPWSAKLLRGGYDGVFWWMGFAVSLQPKWKTYWRVPGDGGIAPDIKLVGENLKSFDVLYPLPKRFEDEAGMTIGYKEEVVFPIIVAPVDPLKPVMLQFNSFIGVCDVVCIPAQYESEISFDPAVSSAPDMVDIASWSSRVPMTQSERIMRAASVTFLQGKPAVTFTLAQTVADIFVEGNPLHYFGKPLFDGQTAVLPVSGVKAVEDLKTTPLRVTIAMQTGALEEMVTVV